MNFEARKFIGSSELHQAAQEGEIEKLGSLLFAGAGDDLDRRSDDDQMTPVVAAAWAGNASCVKALLDAGAHVDSTDDAGRTALMWSVWRGHHLCAKILIDAGAGVNLGGYDGITSLMYAAMHGESECIHLLLLSGADIGKKDGSGNAAPDYAHTFGKSDVFSSEILRINMINDTRLPEPVRRNWNSL